eukprot:Plantae.Rhodophyta-Purpureofilum_apyrenoidigerum.ctg12729.p1 GENE.Plantae.Rhodophyta-Purpureofilum_apyrenoidigerum.ctg12729~~Plantae.Rhodophyta-Purpureofilum_apyrenoidigerum.ctg12729.p1  ORF type:complete len:507 (+),score=62.37 Plantae.Rhodophyta-Purpureofilum_apyrenoidigerum.ctg12729:58-1521(+)
MEPRERGVQGKTEGQNFSERPRMSVAVGSLFVFVLAAIVRFHNVSLPSSVVFDEVVYTKFINHVLERQFFFDVFPPLGKLVLGTCAEFAGWNSAFEAQTISQQYPLDVSYDVVRAVNALFGATASMVLVLIASEADLSLTSSILAGCLMAFDLLSTIQSRIIMADMLMILLLNLSLLCALRAWRRRREGSAVAMPWFAASGLFSGLALATKWTSYATPMLIMFVSFFGVPPFVEGGPMPMHFLLVFSLSCFASYYYVFVVFLQLCNHSGPGDAFTSRPFQASLVGSQFADEYTPLPMHERIWEYNKLMFSYQKIVRGNVKVEPTWLQWISNSRGTVYALERTAGGSKSIYLILNPALALVVNISIFVFLLLLFYFIRYRRSQKNSLQHWRRPLQRGSSFFFSWLGSMLPTLVVFRCGPMYQYLPSLVFALLLCAQTADFLSVRYRTVIATVAVSLTILAFIFWAPWVYGTLLDPLEYQSRKLISGWN